jgi:hypothetical protein
MEKILHLGGLHVTEVPMFAPIMIGIAMWTVMTKKQQEVG